MYAKTDNANLKKDLSSIELPAKLLNWFSRINKSNINQTVYSYLALLIGSWNLQQNGRCEPFWARGELFGPISAVFGILAPREQESQIFYLT